MTTQTTERPAPIAARYYRIADLAVVLDVSTSQAHVVVAQEGFPAAIRLTERGDRRWLRTEVDAWLDSRPRVSAPLPRTKATAKDQAELDLQPIVSGTRRRRAA